jgi:amidase
MFVLEECTVEDIRAALEKGEISSYELTLQYMDRVARYDKSGPLLNSILEINPDALFIAAAMDRERKRGRVRSPLHGVPIVLKDNINTHDKMRTSAGSLALADNYAPHDAAITGRIRAAGLVIMGKTNMTEFANYMSYTMRNGYSSRGGQVLNPYNPAGDTSGSSSGSAVAVSANLCAVAVGTETNGSIICPCFMNGLVGVKPTVGLVSRHGIIPICASQDTAGPMTRTVADAAALLTVLAGEDERDPSTLAWERPAGYTAFLRKDGLKGLRLGINRGYWGNFNFGIPGLVEEQEGLAEEAFAAMKSAGAELIDPVNLPHRECDSSVLLYEFKQCLNAYLAGNPALRCRSLKDIIDFCGDHPRECLRYGMDILLDAQYKTSGTLTESKYLLDRAESLRHSRKEGLDKALDENKLDILVCPGVSDASPISGYPSIIVPAGHTSDRMPFGVTFVGRPFSEPLLIQAAYSYEQASKKRIPPAF